MQKLEQENKILKDEVSTSSGGGVLLSKVLEKIESYEAKMLTYFDERKQFDIEVRRNWENTEDLNSCIWKQAEDIVNLKKQMNLWREPEIEV